jgi:rsbT co-antagonist protein RsbR
VRQSDGAVEQEVENLLRSDNATRADLAVALERLRHEVDERRETERDLREKLDVIRRQDEAIRALSTPILQVWDGVLALPLIGVLDSRRAGLMTEELLAEIVKTQSRHVLLDLTGVDVVDTSTADHLLKVIRAVELLGARAVITGIGPSVAQTMTSLGLDLSRLKTLANLQQGLKHCIAEAGRETSGSGPGAARPGRPG